MRELVTRARLAELFDFDAAAGQFVRKTSRGLGRAGQCAGSAMSSGYRQMCVDGRMHYAHRLVWLWVHGTHPENEIDHINGDKADNRPENIRAATKAQNQQNLPVRKDNKSGYPGVVKIAYSGRWRAGIKVDGKFINLGQFEVPEDAYAAYLAGKARLHQFNPTVRAA